MKRIVRAKYISYYHPSTNTIYIHDLDGPGCPSVTNDAEAVVAEVIDQYQGCNTSDDPVKIFYQDTMGRWDQMCHEDGVFTHFAPGGV